jgi:hypothetical protein
MPGGAFWRLAGWRCCAGAAVIAATPLPRQAVTARMAVQGRIIGGIITERMVVAKSCRVEGTSGDEESVW